MGGLAPAPPNLELRFRPAYGVRSHQAITTHKRDETPPMQPSERRPSATRGGLIIVATLATAYMASHFFRASNVTIGLDLMHDLSIGPEALGALTGAFFFGFAAMQIPCGFFFDHFGPRRTVVGMLHARHDRRHRSSRQRRVGQSCSPAAR